MSKPVVRGNPVPFSVSFTDGSGAPVTPASATLTVNYYAGGRRQSQTIAMTQGTGNAWTATWDSSVAGSGHVCAFQGW